VPLMQLPCKKHTCAAPLAAASCREGGQDGITAQVRAKVAEARAAKQGDR